MTDFVVHNNDRPTLQQCRFEGSGVLHAAKYLGSAVLADGQSQLLCQEAMWSVLASLKGRKLPKERLEIRLSLADGVQIREVAAPDGAGGVSKLDLKFGHSEISYVFKEPRDQRSCGLVRTEPNPDSPGQTIHRFYAVRTVKSASPLMKDLRDLFQLVKQRRDEQRAETPVPTAPSQPARAEVAAETQSQEQQSAAASLKSEQSAAPSSPDLLDIRQQPIRQSAVSSSLGSLDELSELFSSQASLASSGVGGDGGICGGVVSFDPWASQLLPPPPVQMARQLSQPHPAPAVQLPGEPLFRKASHPSVLEQRRLSNSVYGNNGYQGNSKRPSDPGAQLAFLPPDYYQRLQQAEYFYHLQQQQQALAPGQYHPLNLYQQQQQQLLYQPAQAAPAWPEQPLLPPTRGTQLIEGEFVSVFDRPPELEQQKQKQ
ncbi:hypothetical protein BOX15_Mlig014939g1 [Macrostomum lignano]|uniref:Uncharacterized protein n=2 Tax=Macrostomum lignano TaxID=282301 RepID=A0A267GV14_9PLAT|nr:hypothetical protein BOX15_Mlig014939g1 [Macrostomum lignano]